MKRQESKLRDAAEQRTFWNLTFLVMDGGGSSHPRAFRAFHELSVCKYAIVYAGCVGEAENEKVVLDEEPKS